MRRETDRAFLLRSVNYKESDRIVTLFLEQFGKISAMAKGARKSWRRFGGALEPFSLFEVTVVKGKGNLWRLDESNLLSAHNDLAKNLSLMAAAGFILELLRELTPENEPQPAIFSLIDEVFSLLEKTPPQKARIVAIAAQLHVLSLAGMGVSLQSCNACGVMVPKGRPVRFHPARGGVVCTPCGGGPMTFAATSIGALIEMDRNPLSVSLDIEFEDEALNQVEEAIAQFVEHHLGKSVRIKTYC